MDLNIKDGDKATPLHFAASRGHLAAVRWLIKRGAQLTPDKFGKTPLHDAEENRQAEVVSLLEAYSNDNMTSTSDDLGSYEDDEDAP